MLQLARLACFALLAVGFGPGAAAQFDAEAPEPRAPLGGSIALSLRKTSIADRIKAMHAPEERSQHLRWAQGEPLPTAEQIAAVRWVFLQLDSPEGVTASFEGAGLDDALRQLLERDGFLIADGPGSVVLGESYRSLDQAQPQGGLGLLPGMQVEALGLPEDQGGHQPGLVRLSMAPLATLNFRGRRLKSFPGVEVYASLLPGEGREARRIHLGMENVDLLALTRAARQREAGPWPATKAVAPKVPKGSLLILGGGALQPELGPRLLELAGGPDAPVVFVPCTEAETVSREPGMCRVLRSWGFRNVSWVHTKDRQAADSDESILGPLRKARLVWFGGGRQWNLVDSWQHTEAHRLMHAVLERGGVIAGSSAGASIQADYLCRGNPLGNREIMSEGYERGLGFLRGCGVDQHFTQRGRQGDMQQLVQAFPQLLGIGLDEGTGILVQGSLAEVLGPDKAWFYDGRQAGGKDVKPTVLAAGERYDLAERRTAEPAGAAGQKR